MQRESDPGEPAGALGKKTLQALGEYFLKMVVIYLY